MASPYLGYSARTFLRFLFGIILIALFVHECFMPNDANHLTRTLVLLVTNFLYFALMIAIDLLEELVSKKEAEAKPAPNQSVLPKGVHPAYKENEYPFRPFKC